MTDIRQTEGLDGVVAATTRLSHVDGERGELVIGGFPLGELAAHATFEETTWLLWHARLPGRRELDAFRAELAERRALSAASTALLRACVHAGLEPMLTLRVVAGTLSLEPSDARGERLMGFGHRVYKVRDPRADVLAAAAERLFADGGGDPALYALARSVEATALRLLEEYKPGRRLRTNVEFYTALLLHGLGLDLSLFTPTFAVSRASGWIAHALEQRATGRLIRPRSAYAGPRDRRWVPLEERVPAE